MIVILNGIFLILLQLVVEQVCLECSSVTEENRPHYSEGRFQSTAVMIGR